MSNKRARILVLDARIDDFGFLLINIYNANTEKEQFSVLNELPIILSNFENINNHNVIFMLAGEFDIIFDSSLDPNGGTSTLKSWSINKLTEFNETIDLCDIWRMRNPKKSKCTFQQIHLSGTRPRLLDYIFISENLQVYVKESVVLNVLSTDQLPVFCSISKGNEINKGKGLWKNNTFLIFDIDFVKQIKKLIEHIKQQQFSESD